MQPGSDAWDTTAVIGGVPVAYRAVNTVVLGTGAAGYATAVRLRSAGVDVAMVTDHARAGTSRNAGSDKQTYYKLTLAGDAPDSVQDLAATLAVGGAMDGDIALVEAATSARAFAFLVELGVAFPTDDLGQYVGYKTDHDPRQRATSAGPLTSRQMVEGLERRARQLGVPVWEGCRAVDIVVAAGRAVGLVVWLIREARLGLIACTHLVVAAGGPADLHAQAVYPHGQHGTPGLGLRAGAVAHNLTEWQFGLASITPRWNVSGTYLQAIPRLISTDLAGGDPREFLADTVPDAAERHTMTFLKGYQWPFDATKTATGSSRVDLAVLRETAHHGRRVWLDFRTNPGSFDPSGLAAEARAYLDSADGLLGATPVDRLIAMNPEAYEFYRRRGVDLAAEPLEVHVAAQHHNGGLAVDTWWRTSVDGLYAVGEAAGTHGVYRPGGAALNAGQVGALRAATAIARDDAAPPEATAVMEAAAPLVARATALLDQAASGAIEPATQLAAWAREFDAVAGLRRDPAALRVAWQSAAADWARLAAAGVPPPCPGDHPAPSRHAGPDEKRRLDDLVRLYDAAAARYVHLAALVDYCEHGGGSRGSALYTDTATRDVSDSIQECRWDGVGSPTITWRPVRPIPERHDAFEVVWRAWRTRESSDTP